MPRNGSGSYNLPNGPFVPSTVISSTVMNQNLSDLGTALTSSIANDGQTTPVANLPMATFRHTNVGNAVARTDYAAAGQVQDSSLQWLTSVAGTDTITASITPSPTAYTAGQTFRFIAAGTNTTTTVTLNINGLGAKNLTKRGAVALVQGDIVSGSVYEVVYDGTQFQVIAGGVRVLAKVIADNPTAQAVANNTLVPITNWTERLDTTNSFNPVTGVFTAPRAGQYMVTGIYRLASASFTANTGVAAILLKNGVQHRSAGLVTVSAGTWATQSAQLSCMVDLASGDTLVLNAFQNSGASINTVSSVSDDTLTITEVL